MLTIGASGVPWWFAAVAAGMVAVAALFVLPRPWRLARAGADGPLPGSTGRRWRLALPLLALPALALALYLWLGDPGAADPSRAALSAQLRDPDAPLGEAAAGHVLAELQQHLQRQPGDARAWVMKARLDMQAQRYEQAAAGFEQALQGKSKTAGDAGLWVEYAEARGLQQGGTLAGAPRQLVDKALSLNPEHPQALDLAGSAAWEAGEFALAATQWTRLLTLTAEGSPRHVQLSSAIQRAEQRARFALPPAR
ncbi:MAG: tetratricopeptide repeat protein [Rubrivivax sp.]